MISRLHFVLIFFFLKSSFSYAQLTEIINSNRPGLSVGAYAVGKNILHIESGSFFVKEKHNLRNYEMSGYGFDFGLRYGLLKENLEIIISGIYQSDNFKDFRFNPVNEYERKNFKNFKIGAKYLIFNPYKNDDQKPNIYSYWANRKFNIKNLIPAVSAYIGLNIDTKDNPYTTYNLNGLSPTISIITQSNFTNRSVLIINLSSERIGTDQNDFEYLICLTYAFNENFIAFLEKHGIKSDFYADNKLSFGLAYLFNDNLQFDIGLTSNFKDTPSVFHVNTGISYRLNLFRK